MDTFWVALVFIGIFSTILLIPCVGVTLLGVRMINRLGVFPSKTPAIQLGVVWKLIIVELVSFTLLLLFYHIFADYTEESQRETKYFSQTQSQ